VEVSQFEKTKARVRIRHGNESTA